MHVHLCVTPCVILRLVCVICKIVRLVMLYILFNCTMFIRGHLDAQISGARVLVAVICWFLSELEICYFCIILSLHLMGMSSTCVLLYDMPSFQGCMPCIFVISVVTSTSMQTRLRDVSDFRDLVNLPSL